MPPKKVRPSPAQIQPQTSTKRLASGKAKETKYYAVRAGKVPGVYMDYSVVLENVTGFKKAVFKSFTSREDANAFMSGREVVSKSTSIDKTAEKYYGVAAGHVPGVYTEWTDAQTQIEAFKGPKYKRFNTKEDAEAFVRSGGASAAPRRPPGRPPLSKNREKSTAKSLKSKPEENGEDAEDEVEEEEERDEPEDVETASIGLPPAKKTKLSRVSISKPTPVSEDEDAESEPEDMSSWNSLTIYTDGSSLGNGRAGAIAGVGVFFGPKDPRNISEPLLGAHQTNQRAELTAIQRALQVAPLDQEVKLYTDSKYSIDCVTVWYKGWERNGWKSTLQKDVVNKDVIQDIRAKIRAREDKGAQTHFLWVKGHSDDPGNGAADKLAVAGANRARAGM